MRSALSESPMIFPKDEEVFFFSRNRGLDTGQANENLSTTYQEVSWQSTEESNGSTAPSRYLYSLGAPRERTRSYVLGYVHVALFIKRHSF